MKIVNIFDDNNESLQDIILNYIINKERSNIH